MCAACVIDWGLVADWLTVALSAVTLLLAYWALNAWRAQLHGTSRHAVAQEVSTTARALRYAYYDARSPLLEPWEFPEQSFWELNQLTEVEQADAYWHVYQNRLKEMWPQMKALADCRAKAGILGDPVADAVEELAKTGRRLSFYMQDHTRVIRAGESVAGWTDQVHVAKVKGVLATRGTNEPISNEFEEAMKVLLKKLEPNLALDSSKK